VGTPDYVVVIPTVGRPSLQACLGALAGAAAAGPPPQQVVLADDRRDTPDPLPVAVPPGLRDRTIVVTLEGRGPAAARNAGWRAAAPAEWVVFLDDDVRVGPGWAEQLAADLAGAAQDVAGVQGVIEVPPPRGRRPTDAERATLGLAGAAWITADMAYRRGVLADTGGFDERFTRAFREDSDLALRAEAAGWQLRRGRRVTVHPLRPGGRGEWRVSLAAQAGNADDAAMRRQHGARWQARAGTGTGRRPAHLAATGLGLASLTLLAASLSRAGAGTAQRQASADRAQGRASAGTAQGEDSAATELRRAAAGTALRRAGGAAAAGWLAVTGEFAAARIGPGPRTWREVAAMTATSAAIPPLAVWHWLAGWWRHRRDGPWPGPPAAVLFDRDGTLVHDVPYNGDPGLARPVDGAADAVAALRRAGMRVGVVTNQSGIARGLITPAQAEAVNRRVGELIGPFDVWRVCPHGETDGCRCRKPAPGMITEAAALLGLDPADCAVIGDTAADVAAARAAGARGVLVPAAATLASDRAGVPCAATLTEAVTALLDGTVLPSWPSRAR
jgi:HAD superfamily hydrolase (TIGR01662 family)